MLGARLVDIRNNGFGASSPAVLVLAALSAVINVAAPDPVAAFLPPVMLGAMLLADLLGTRFLRGDMMTGVVPSLTPLAVIIGLAVVVAGGSDIAGGRTRGPIASPWIAAAGRLHPPGAGSQGMSRPCPRKIGSTCRYRKIDGVTQFFAVVSDF